LIYDYGDSVAELYISKIITAENLKYTDMDDKSGIDDSSDKEVQEKSRKSNILYHRGV
jgi:hypothetical protein